MATAAERQRAHRQRHRDAGGGRISMDVSAHAEAALKRLALHCGVTQKVMLERLIAEADSATADQLTGAAQTAYFAVTV